MGRRIVVMKLICSFGRCECDGHTVQRLLTADLLAPGESDCSRMHSKVSSDWLKSYIKATQLVLEIFKTAGYFPDSPRRSQFVGKWQPHMQTRDATFCEFILLHSFTLAKFYETPSQMEERTFLNANMKARDFTDEMYNTITKSRIFIKKKKHFKNYLVTN